MPLTSTSVPTMVTASETVREHPGDPGEDLAHVDDRHVREPGREVTLESRSSRRVALALSRAR